MCIQHAAMRSRYTMMRASETIFAKRKWLLLALEGRKSPCCTCRELGNAASAILIKAGDRRAFLSARDCNYSRVHMCNELFVCLGTCLSCCSCCFSEAVRAHRSAYKHTRRYVAQLATKSEPLCRTVCQRLSCEKDVLTGKIGNGTTSYVLRSVASCSFLMEYTANPAKCTSE